MRNLPLLVVASLLAGCALGPPEAPTPYPVEVLTGDEFTSLLVEIDHAPGRAPSLLARDHLLQELRNVTSKTRVNIIVEESLPDEPGKRWTGEQLVALEQRTRSATHAAPVALLHILYPAGEYERDGVAGVTIIGPTPPPVTVFLDTIDRIESPVGALPLPRQARDEVERATLLHEAGHAMGLVNSGLEMVRDHEDRENPGHSSNPQSVMYWRVETLAGIREALVRDGTLPLYFDADDRADMRAVGGR